VSFQETVKRSLTRDIAKIVKSIEGSTEVVRQEIQEAEHKAELRRQQWEAQQERWSREEDQRQIAKSIGGSREQLNQIIQAWTKAVSIEQFLRGVEERASNLSEAEREVVQERLRLAREFIGVQDPLEFLLSWKSPSERYVPLATRTS
jgi:Mg-chelatase subunit ChlI